MNQFMSISVFDKILGDIDVFVRLNWAEGSLLDFDIIEAVDKEGNFVDRSKLSEYTVAEFLRKVLG